MTDPARETIDEQEVAFERGHRAGVAFERDDARHAYSALTRVSQRLGGLPASGALTAALNESEVREAFLIARDALDQERLRRRRGEKTPSRDALVEAVAHELAEDSFWENELDRAERVVALLYGGKADA